MIVVQTLQVIALAAGVLSAPSSCGSWEVQWRCEGSRYRRSQLVHHKSRSGWVPLQRHVIPRGGYQPEVDDTEATSNQYGSEDRRGAPASPHRREERELTRTPEPSASTLSGTLGSMAKRSVTLTRKAVQLTAQQSTRAAYHVLRPKTVELEELVGLWRVDQELSLSGGEDDDHVFTMELALVAVRPERTSNRGTLDRDPSPTWRRIQITITDGDGTTTVARDVQFRPSTSPLTHAQLRFTHRGLQYKAVVHRKLADPSVLKLKGTVTYRPPEPARRGLWQALGGGGAHSSRRDEKVGTFVARRRMKLDDEVEHEEDDGEEEDDDDYDVDAYDAEPGEDGHHYKDEEAHSEANRRDASAPADREEDGHDN